MREVRQRAPAHVIVRKAWTGDVLGTLKVFLPFTIRLDRAGRKKSRAHRARTDHGQNGRKGGDSVASGKAQDVDLHLLSPPNVRPLR